MTIGMKNDDENDDQEGRAERGNEDGYVCFPWMWGRPWACSQCSGLTIIITITTTTTTTTTTIVIITTTTIVIKYDDALSRLRSYAVAMRAPATMSVKRMFLRKGKRWEEYVVTKHNQVMIIQRWAETPSMTLKSFARRLASVMAICESLYPKLLFWFL